MRIAIMIIVTAICACHSGLAMARDNEKATLYKPATKPQKNYNWYVVVCSSRAESVVLQAGSSDNDNSVFAKWSQHDGQRRFPLPGWLQARTKVYVRMSIPEGKWQTEACVGYNGYAKQAFRFDSNNESHNISFEDNDNGCACR
jgi:hypothetical protein